MDRTRWGALLFLLRPTYVVTEVVVAAATTGGYSFLDATVSELGAIGCDADYCSPRHAVMNGSFVGYGVILALAALLLAPHLGRVATALLVIAGTSSVAVGFVPLDQDSALHTLVAAPLFVAQPVALLVLARALHDHPVLARGLAAAGVTTAVAAVGFVVLGGSTGQGALERLALWPVLIALAAVGATYWSDRRAPTGPSTRLAPNG